MYFIWTVAFHHDMSKTMKISTYYQKNKVRPVFSTSKAAESDVAGFSLL